MIRDTSATDRLVEVGSNRNRKLIYIGAGIAVVAALAFAVPHLATMFSADSSVSASRLSFATVTRGPFVRDIAAEGKVELLTGFAEKFPAHVIGILPLVRNWRGGWQSWPILLS